jgi:3-hydroxyacyl-[acyl-carrier-protein] dehydratase
MIDRVLERSTERVVALKNVSHNEWYFVGHFPGRPVMPGTLIVEGMAQTAGLLIEPSSGSAGPAQGYLVGIDRARFRRMVVPGDQIIYEAKLVKAKGGLIRAEVEARVEGERIAEAVISVMSDVEGAERETH